jgi:hypothetical protein
MQLAGVCRKAGRSGETFSPVDGIDREAGHSLSPDSLGSSTRDPSGNFPEPFPFLQTPMEAGAEWQRPVLMQVMGLLECGPKMAVVLHPRVNPFLKKFAPVSRIPRGDRMGFVVDALAEFFRANKVALVGEAAADGEAARFIR